MQDENKNDTQSQDNLMWPQAEPIKTTSPFDETNKEEITNGDVKEKLSELEGVNKEAMREILEETNDSSESNLFSDENQEAEPAIKEFFPPEEKEESNLFNQEVDEQVVKEEFLDNKETVVINKRKLNFIKKLIINIEENTKRLNELLASDLTEDDGRVSISQVTKSDTEEMGEEIEGNIIEGVFNGQFMIGPDGKQYNVPVNYASKSKLVEGDILKLTIAGNGKFIYKQISPIERDRIVGKLIKDSAEYYVHGDDNRKWKILTASVTYFKGNLEDEVIILVPKHGESNWAAVENIVNQS